MNLFDALESFPIIFFSKSKHWEVQNGFWHFFPNEDGCISVIANPAWLCFCFVIHFVHSFSMRNNLSENSREKSFGKNGMTSTSLFEAVGVFEPDDGTLSSIRSKFSAVTSFTDSIYWIMKYEWMAHIMQWCFALFLQFYGTHISLYVQKWGRPPATRHLPENCWKFFNVVHAKVDAEKSKEKWICYDRILSCAYSSAPCRGSFTHGVNLCETVIYWILNNISNIVIVFIPKLFRYHRLCHSNHQWFHTANEESWTVPI